MRQRECPLFKWRTAWIDSNLLRDTQPHVTVRRHPSVTDDTFAPHPTYDPASSDVLDRIRRTRPTATIYQPPAPPAS